MKTQMCLQCDQRPVTIVADSYGQGFCSQKCRNEVARELAQATYEEAKYEYEVMKLRMIGAI